MGGWFLLDDNILVFHYADRAKAFIIETFRLFEHYQRLEGLEAEKLMLEILKGCEKEIKLGERICSSIGWAENYFKEASRLAKGLIRDFNRKDHDQVKEDLRNMLNKMTTCAVKAKTENIN